MIHVVHVLTRTNVGGPSVMLVDLLKGLDPNEFRQTVVRGVSGGAEGDYLAAHPVSVDVVTLKGLRRSIGLLREIHSFIALTRTLRRLRPDIVHTHMAKAGVVGRLAALCARVPIRIHTFHGHLLHGYFTSIISKLIVAIERVLNRLTSFALVVGNATRRDLLNAKIVTEDRSRSVLPGMQKIVRMSSTEARGRLGLPVDQVIVGFVGRLTQIKRPDRFLRIATAVPHAHFVLIGDGPLRAKVREQMNGIRNISMCEFTSDLSMVFGALDVLVLTSDNEGVPLSVMEAAAAGIPVMAMNVGGVSEIVRDGITGLLAKTEHDLVAGVSRLVIDQTLRLSLGAAASAAIGENCSMEKYLSVHADLYRSLYKR